MNQNEKPLHLYIPNSAPHVKAEMPEFIGLNDSDELYSDIPESLPFRGQMNLPKSFISECELKRHVEKILSKNKTCGEYINFLGGCCYQHYVPAVCDEVANRSEFRCQRFSRSGSLISGRHSAKKSMEPLFTALSILSMSLFPPTRITGVSKLIASASA